MEPCQGPATCSGLLMKIRWAGSEILWLQVGIGAGLKVKMVWWLPSQPYITASLTNGRILNTHDNKTGM